MLRKLSETGTIEACQLPIVAAHFRLSAQMISVTTAIARMTHAMAWSFQVCGLERTGAAGNPKEAARSGSNLPWPRL